MHAAEYAWGVSGHVKILEALLVTRPGLQCAWLVQDQGIGTLDWTMHNGPYHKSVQVQLKDPLLHFV